MRLEELKLPIGNAVNLRFWRQKLWLKQLNRASWWILPCAAALAFAFDQPAKDLVPCAVFWHEGSLFTVGGFVDFLNDQIVYSFSDWILA